MELVKNYDCNINYYPKKGNVVTNALSMKALENLEVMITTQREILRDLVKYEKEVVMVDDKSYLIQLIV